MSISNWVNVARSYWWSKNPPYLIFQITSGCNSRCLTCFNWEKISEHPSKEDLTLDEIEKISRNYGRLLQLTLGGGEPFLRNDIDQICSIFNRYSSVQHITIPTNALLPERVASKVEAILETCSLNYLRIGLSLDAIGEEHDRIRGVPGNYEKLVETYKALVPLKKKFRNLGVEVSSVLSALNCDSIVNTIDVVKKEFPHIDKHAIVMIRGDARVAETKSVSPEKYREVIKYLSMKNVSEDEGKFIPRFFKAVFNLNTQMVYDDLKGNGWKITCLAGEKLLIITSNGDVYPCEILGTKLGNLRKSGYDVSSIMCLSDSKEVINKIKRDKCSCSFECAIHASLIFDLKNFPRILLKMIKSN